jgi:DNA-3-methyladenine glycosylase II
VLSLDIDGSGFSDVTDADEALRGIATLYQGLRPVLFPTPFEAACWAVLSQRTRTPQAAAVRTRLAARHGSAMAVGGRTFHAFPAPGAVLDIDAFDGVSASKLERLHAVADAATDGALDPATLRDMTADDALVQLRQITGIGPFGAELILVRGAGAPDIFPSRERRLHEAMAELYGVDDPSVDDLAGIADRWRPYRSWAALLLRAWCEQHRR